MKNWLLLLVASFGLLVTGCGGSGSGSDAAATPATEIFATDDLNTGFDHVWVTIDKVDLTGTSGTTNLFDDTANGGKVVDLRTLRDATGGKFLLLGGCNTPSGTFTGVNVTVSSALSIVTAGSKSATPATFANSTGSTFVLSLTFTTPQKISATNKVLVDFDLANWTLTDASVSATNNQFLSQGSTTGLSDGSRHCPSDYDGVVSALTGTGPSQTFTLTDGKSSITVAMTADTTIANSDGSSNAAITNGERLTLNGSFDPTSTTLTAKSITIRVGTGKKLPARVVGLVTAVDTTGNTITVQVQDCDHFQPSATTVTIDATSTTMFIDGSGVTDTESQFLSTLVPNTSEVFAEGTLSGTTLAATTILMAPTAGSNGTGDDGGKGGSNHHEIALQGLASNASATAGTFDVALANWEGGALSRGGVVHVISNTTTQFTNAGAPETQAGFFTALTPTSQVQVRGTFDFLTMTVTATHVNTGTGKQFHF